MLKVISVCGNIHALGICLYVSVHVSVCACVGVMSVCV